MIATCPKDPTHKRFLTTAHVMEEWVVDETGEFLEISKQLETDVGPDPENVWWCTVCMLEASVKADG